MINFILETLLLDGVDALLMMLIVLGFDLKSLAKEKLFLSWFVITVLARICSLLTFGIPTITQALMAYITAIILCKFFDLNKKRCIIDCFIMSFVVMLVSDVFWYLLINIKMNVDYMLLTPLDKFIYGLGSRFIQINIIYYYRKRCFMGRYWFFGKDEEVEKEVEVEVEETEEE